MLKLYPDVILKQYIKQEWKHLNKSFRDVAQVKTGNTSDNLPNEIG